MNVLVVAAAPVAGSTQLIARLAPLHDAVIAVDGGGALCLAADVRPDVALGDFDSLDAVHLGELQQAGVRIETFPADKDLTDLEIALEEARRMGADHVTVTAASSGRLDHTLATLGALSRVADLTPDLVEPSARAWMLDARGRCEMVVGAVGETLSLIAIGGPATVSVTGVRWPLDHATLEAGSGLGVSNVVARAQGARVTTHDGSVLVYAPASV